MDSCAVVLSPGGVGRGQSDQADRAVRMVDRECCSGHVEDALEDPLRLGVLAIQAIERGQVAEPDHHLVVVRAQAPLPDLNGPGQERLGPGILHLGTGELGQDMKGRRHLLALPAEALLADLQGPLRQRLGLAGTALEEEDPCEVGIGTGEWAGVARRTRPGDLDRLAVATEAVSRSPCPRALWPPQ